jgi:hypothetical protein
VRIFYKIMSISQHIVMALNNVVSRDKILYTLKTLSNSGPKYCKIILQEI